MAQVVTRHVCSEFAPAFVAYSGCSIRYVHDVWKLQATPHVNDLWHIYISARRYAISGPLLWYIGPVASNVSGL